MLPDFAYIRARSKQEALDNLASGGAHVHAGGTNLVGCVRDQVYAVEKLVSISRLEERKGITRTGDGGLRIGALTTISEIAQSSMVQESYPGLAQAAGDVASPQLRNQGTLGGNLCQRPRCWYFRGDFHCAKKGGDMCYAVEGENRYHAIFGGDPCYIVHPSDTAPMLVALGAEVRVSGASLYDFVGPEFDFYTTDTVARARCFVEAGPEMCQDLKVQWQLGHGADDRHVHGSFTPTPGANTWTIDLTCLSEFVSANDCSDRLRDHTASARTGLLLPLTWCFRQL